MSHTQRNPITTDDVLVVVAHPDELNDDLRQLPNLLLTGVGKVNATYALTRRLADLRHAGKMPKYVINLGSAGSRHHPRHSLVACHRFIQRDMDCTMIGYEHGTTPGDTCGAILEHARYVTDLPDGICGSGDSFVTTQSVRAPIDVVEMEAYALARVCTMENVPFIAVKYITDGLDAAGGDDWDDAVSSAADKLYEYLMKLIKNLK